MITASVEYYSSSQLTCSHDIVWYYRSTNLVLDIRVLSLHAFTNKTLSLSKCYRKHEVEKKRTCGLQILHLEHSNFTLLVFLATRKRLSIAQGSERGPGLSPCRQVGTPIQFDPILDMIPPVLLPAAISNIVYRGCMLVPRSSSEAHSPH